MNKLQEELKEQIKRQLEAQSQSSVEKAQAENTRRLLDFIYGTVIWMLSFSLFSLFNQSFRIILYLTLFAVDLLISSIGKRYDIQPAPLLKIRLTILYLIIILIAMIES